MSQNKPRNKANGSAQASQGNRPQQQKQKTRTKFDQSSHRSIQSGSSQGVPAAMSTKLKQFVPKESVNKRGVRSIIYKEYIQDVLGSVAFTVTSFACNPGLASMFAWLAAQALFYQEYRVKRLRFVFETEKATSLGGKVMLAFVQDSSDDVPGSKQEMLEHQLKASGAIWQHFFLEVGMGNFPALGKSRFVRGGTLAANLDVKTYDIGALQVATMGCADASAVGELYVEYEIELVTPIMNIGVITQAQSARIVGGGAITDVAIFGTTPVVTGGLLVTAATNTITFNTTGQFLLAIFFGGTGITTTDGLVFTGTATTTLGTGNGNAAANAGTAGRYNAIVSVTTRGQTCIIDASGFTTVTSTIIRIGPYLASLA